MRVRWELPAESESSAAFMEWLRWNSPAKLGYLFGDQAGRRQFEHLAERGWLALPGTRDGKNEAYPQPRPLERWMAFVYRQLDEAASSYLAAEDVLWVADYGPDGQLVERRYDPCAVTQGNIVSTGYPDAGGLSDRARRWVYTALATDPFTVSAVAIDALLAHPIPGGARLVSWREMDAYQKSPAFQNSNFLVDFIILANAKRFPVFRWDCKPVPGATPSICPSAEPKPPMRLKSPGEIMADLEKRFRDLHLVGDGETIHWVGRQATVESTCVCHLSAAPLAPASLPLTKPNESLRQPEDENLATLASWRVYQQQRERNDAELRQQQRRKTKLERAFIAVRARMPEADDDAQAARAYAARWGELARLIAGNPDLVHCQLENLPATVGSPKAYALRLVSQAAKGDVETATKMLLDSWEASRELHWSVLHWLQGGPSSGLEAEITGWSTTTSSSAAVFDQPRSPAAVESKPRPDLVVVTVNEHETQAVLDQFRATTGRAPVPVPLDGRVYHDLGTLNDTWVFHAISGMGTGGTDGMQVTVDKAIRALDPGAVIAVGIGFGVDEVKQAIGDILVSKQLRLYELQRVGRGGRKSKIVLRGDRPPASARLVNHFVAFAHSTWKGAPVKFGLLLTGDKLVDNVDYRKQLLTFESEALGGEMEGAGLFVSGHENKVDWIVVKAICDWADGNKEENKEARQKMAARNAAEFVVESLKYAALKSPDVVKQSE
jgi:nucleoside phosphorylase